MTTPDRSILPDNGNSANLDPPSANQSFTICCAECGDTLSSHLPNCPGVLFAGYDSGRGAATVMVYPTTGGSFSTHADAVRALDFYSRLGPVEMRLQDGRIFNFMDLDHLLPEDDAVER
jgi:hypothetical protein